jgi:predicted nucleotidyltransferase
MLEDTNVPEKIKDEISRIIKILQKAGCSEIYLFGSIAENKYKPGSDIDIAVKQLNKADYFDIYGRIISGSEINIDLIVLDYDNDFTNMLKKRGTFKRVA